MITTIKRYALLAASLYLAACSSVSVVTDYDKSAVFQNYKTYSLVPSDDQMPLAPSVEAAFQNTLRTQLGARSLVEVSENADLHIVRRLSTKEKLSVHQSSMSYGAPYRYGHYGSWTGAPAGYTDVSQYTQGTLVLDFVDAKTQKLVFRGTGSATVDKPETNAEHMKEVVEKIVQDYPVQAH